MRLSMSMPPSNRSSASPSRSDQGDSLPILAVHEYSPQPRGLHEHADTSARHSSVPATTYIDLSDIRELLLSVQLQTTSIKEDQQALREQILQEVSAVREDVQLLCCQVDSLANKLEETPRGRSPESIRAPTSPPPVVHLTSSFRAPSPDASSVGHTSAYSPAQGSARTIASVQSSQFPGPYNLPIFSPRSPRTPSDLYPYQQPTDPVPGSAPRSSPKFPSLADSPLPTVPISPIGCRSPEPFIFDHSRSPPTVRCRSPSEPLFGYREPRRLNHLFGPPSPPPRSSVRIKTPTSTTKTPPPVITYKHPPFLRSLAMEAQVPSSQFPPVPAPELTSAFDTYSDAPMGEKSPVFLPSPQSSLTSSTIPYNHVIKYEAVPAPQQIRIPARTAPSPYRSPISPNDPWSMHVVGQHQARSISTQPPSPRTVSCADPASPTSPGRRARLVISPANSLGLEDYPIIPNSDSKVATEELMQEMKAMFRAFKTDIEKDSEALRDRIKDLEERLSREKAKNMSKVGSEEPQSSGPTIIIPPALSGVISAAGTPEVFTAAPTIPVASTNKDARATSPRTSPTVPTSGTFKPWVSTPPVDTTIHMPPIMPPSSAPPPFVPGSIPGGWRATKPRGLPRSSTMGNLSNNYRASPPVIFPDFSYGGIMGNPLPATEFASFDSRPAHLGPLKKRNSASTSMSSHHHSYPSATPLRRSRTEANVMPSMPHYPTPTSSQSYPLSQPHVWNSYTPPHFEPPTMPTIMPPLGMPVSFPQEPSYPITYGGAPLGI